MVAILSIIGVSAIKARIVQQILTIIACFILAYAVKKWLDNTKLFWITLIISLTLPWGFVQANRIWDPSFVPLYFSLYFLFYTLALKTENLTRFKKIIYTLLSFFLVLLAVVYPPCRIPAVALWFYSIYTLREKIDKKIILLIIICCTILSLPLIINLFNPVFNERAVKLSVFYHSSFKHGLYLYGLNFFKLLSPDYLFYSGDIIYRHGLPYFGLLGTISIIPLIYL